MCGAPIEAGLLVASDRSWQIVASYRRSPIQAANFPRPRHYFERGLGEWKGILRTGNYT